ncbi:hypothetical protein ACFQ6U_24030 [Streptomyces sp. NPDC056465]|uniref:hypothetical protein n=1 Tax=unclassified Streptomyces TaxID=2593676 RepID=UPI0035D7B619
MQWTARQEFDRGAGRLQGWGLGLMVVSAVLFLWLGRLLLMPFTVESSFGEIDCDAPVFYTSESTPYSESTPTLCVARRDWPELLALGIFAVPPAVAGAALFTSGSTRKRASAHVFRILEMQDSEERARQRARPDKA